MPRSGSKYRSDKIETWVAASHRVVRQNYAKGALEIQSLGQLHIGLREFERGWIPTDERQAKPEQYDVYLRTPFFFEAARCWVLGIFSAAYKLERGDVYQQRSCGEFKSFLNPLRCAFEKGHIDQHKEIGCFPDVKLNQSPYHCLTWVVPDKNMKLQEYYRVEIAEQFLSVLSAD